MEKDTKEKIEQLQMLEQNMQGLMMQKQQFSTQLIEIESALKELESAKKAYKIVGNVMIDAEKDSLIKDLKEKKEKVELRVKTIESQESKLKEKASSMQSEVLKNIEK